MKKISILLLCLVLISAILPMSAASAKEVPGYATDSKTVNVGETFTVNVSVKENPGIISLSIDYDETVLSLKSVSDRRLFSGFTTPSPSVSSPYVLRWADSLATKDNTSDGVFVTLTFKALKEGSTSVRVMHKEARSCQGKKITFADADTKITVKPAACSHKNTVVVPAVASTCVKQGNSRYVKCADCGYVTSGSSSKLSLAEHKLTSSVTKQPTCTEKGRKAYTCKVCGYSFSEVLGVTSHSFVKKTVAPTCLNKGYVQEKCKSCNAVKSYSETPAKGHSWGTWVKNSSGNTEIRECVTCGTRQSRSTAASSGIEIRENVSLKMVSADTVLVTEGMTAGELLNSVTKGASVVYADSRKASSADVINGTMRIVMTDGNGNITASKSLAVLGDVDADGRVTAADARAALRASVKLEELSDGQKLAADADFGNTVTAADARTILRLSVKLLNAQDCLK